ncbi:MAG: hypothetical protein ABI378_12550 [Chitinophagaceae bacterium]
MEDKKNEENEDMEMSKGETTPKKKATITHNLDTGEDEILPDINDEPTMDFGAGSDGGSESAG